MENRTGVIKFNVGARNRKFRGVNRNFDTATLANLVNGGDVQERVAKGDMLGYYGHWPRVKFGMNPAEGGVVGDKAVAVEPAIRTTFIKAYPDGTIEHEVEFLNTAPGKIAKRMYDSEVGGFSSAITAKQKGSIEVPVGFFGFDYVMEPNFDTNRGYRMALDGVMEGDDAELILLDDAQEYYAMLDGVNKLYDRLHAEHLLLADALKQSELERVELESMLLKAGVKPIARLDGVCPGTVTVHRQNYLDSADDFAKAKLYDLTEKPKPAPQEPSKVEAGQSLIHRAFG